MDTLYCNLGGSRNDTLHISDLRTIGAANHEARTVEDVQRILAETGASAVMFGFSSLPHRAVPLGHAKLDSYIRRVVGYLHKQRPAAPIRPQRVMVDDPAMLDFIDRD